MTKRRSGNRLTRQVGGALNEIEAESKPNPLYTLAETLCYPYVLQNVSALPRPDDGFVRIALISMPNFDYKLADFSLRKNVPRGVDRTDVARTLAAVRGREPDRMLEAYTEALKSALDHHHANIVCISELGLPSRNIKPMVEALKIANEMSRSRNALIIAGSAHDFRTRYNTGYLFHPGGPATGWAFHKASSATSMEERITAPADRRVVIIDTLGLRIATLICLDIADYATLAAVMRPGIAWTSFWSRATRKSSRRWSTWPSSPAAPCRASSLWSMPSCPARLPIPNRSRISVVRTVSRSIEVSSRRAQRSGWFPSKWKSFRKSAPRQKRTPIATSVGYSAIATAHAGTHLPESDAVELACAHGHDPNAFVF
jgi:hypothetical protein